MPGFGGSRLEYQGLCPFVESLSQLLPPRNEPGMEKELYNRSPKGFTRALPLPG